MRKPDQAPAQTRSTLAGIAVGAGVVRNSAPPTEYRQQQPLRPAANIRVRSQCREEDEAHRDREEEQLEALAEGIRNTHKSTPFRSTTLRVAPTEADSSRRRTPIDSVGLQKRSCGPTLYQSCAVSGGAKRKWCVRTPAGCVKRQVLAEIDLVASLGKHLSPKIELGSERARAEGRSRLAGSSAPASWARAPPEVAQEVFLREALASPSGTVLGVEVLVKGLHPPG